MSSDVLPIIGLNNPSGSDPRTRRAIADLVRSMVHSRRGISRIAVVEWVQQFVEGGDQKDSAAAVEDVIESLCELHDIGFGTIRGEPVLIALPERRVALPDGEIIALGDHGIVTDAPSDLLFPQVETGATAALIDLLESLGDATRPSNTGALSAKGRWTVPDAMPTALRRALMLCGAFDPVSQEWSISEANAAFLNEWFSLTDPVESAGETSSPDTSQYRVSQAPPSMRMVVEAGPGSGKTHVACERVIGLVQAEGLAPSRILMLSFTRIAVAELRTRIAARLPDIPDAAALQIRTFDSFAARLLSVSGHGSSGGFDAKIRAATQLLRSGDPLVADAIGQLEHVIIDEAQDLVGDRKALCEALVDLLHTDCGVTVFGDFAQAIYGYQRRDRTGATFLTEIETRAGFVPDRLEHDHRTKTEALRMMFRTARETLRADAGGSRETYFSVRGQIQAAALEKEVAPFATHPATTRGLILTRSRRALFTAAEALRAEGRRFRLRLPDRPLRIEPWIGATLGGIKSSEQISRQAFDDLYDALYPTAARGAEDCWKVLKELDGSGGETVVAGHIAETLEDPPLELLSDHQGSTGPLLSTIHAIKGHEDQRVMLLLTRAPYGDKVDWGEEARTLYVGATRASTELRTGWVNPAKFYKSGKPERYWAPHADHRAIEIGIEGDLIDWRDFLQTGQVADPQETISAIWRAAAVEAPAEAVSDAGGRLVLRRVGEDLSLGCLSPEFAELLQLIRQTEPDASLPERISGFSIVGATTVVVPGNAGEASTLALMPLLGGFARVPR